MNHIKIHKFNDKILYDLMYFDYVFDFCQSLKVAAISIEKASINVVDINDD